MVAILTAILKALWRPKIFTASIISSLKFFPALPVFLRKKLTYSVARENTLLHQIALFYLFYLLSGF